jgi:hypothetical protein
VVIIIARFLSSCLQRTPRGLYILGVAEALEVEALPSQEGSHGATITY